jgi:predicted nucleotidyltransferase
MNDSVPYPAPDGPVPDTSPALRALVAALERRFGDGVQGIVLYGSCLRSADLLEGLVDLYVLVESTPRAEPRLWLRLAGRVLPPNVYYIEAPVAVRTVRCKYAVLSLAQFERGTARWFQSYLWGRFAQPVKVVWSDSPATDARLERAFLQAGETLLRRALPALPPEGQVTDLWQGALGLSYATELRAEKPVRAAELAGHGQDFLAALTRVLQPRLDGMLQLSERDGVLFYHATVSARARRAAPVLWALRRMQGKTLSVVRLIKGLFTFQGGLDYIAWKLTRHSGQVVEIPDKVRRRPLVHIWGLFWQLYRRGVFR